MPLADFVLLLWLDSGNRISNSSSPDDCLDYCNEIVLQRDVRSKKLRATRLPRGFPAFLNNKNKT